MQKLSFIIFFLFSVLTRAQTPTEVILEHLEYVDQLLDQELPLNGLELIKDKLNELTKKVERKTAPLPRPQDLGHRVLLFASDQGYYFCESPKSNDNNDEKSASAYVHVAESIIGMHIFPKFHFPDLFKQTTQKEYDETFFFDDDFNDSEDNKSQSDTLSDNQKEILFQIARTYEDELKTFIFGKNIKIEYVGITGDPKRGPDHAKDLRSDDPGKRKVVSHLDTLSRTNLRMTHIVTGLPPEDDNIIKNFIESLTASIFELFKHKSGSSKIGNQKSWELYVEYRKWYNEQAARPLTTEIKQELTPQNFLLAVKVEDAHQGEHDETFVFPAEYSPELMAVKIELPEGFRVAVTKHAGVKRERSPSRTLKDPKPKKPKSHRRLDFNSAPEQN